MKNEQTNPKLHVYTNIRGVSTGGEASKTITYFGTVYREPNPMIYKRTREKRDELISIYTKLEDDFTDPNGVVWEFYTDGVIERYDIVEKETGDYLTMFRLPYIPKDEALRSLDPKEFFDESL